MNVSCCVGWMQDLPSSMVQILVGFTMCVGLPMFAFHTFELFEMREGLPNSDDDDDEWKSTDDEEEEDGGSGDEDAATSTDEDVAGSAEVAEPTVPETLKSDGGMEAGDQ